MPPAPEGSPAPHEAERLARSFALALRNASVYPADHPRSRGAADQCLALVRERGGLILTAHGPALACNGRELADDTQFEWVVTRLRNAALRGIVIGATCEPDDLLELARGLVATKPGTNDFEWPADHPRLQTVPLVFTGTFGASVAGAAATAVPDQDAATTLEPEFVGPPLPSEFGLGHNSGARVVFDSVGVPARGPRGMARSSGDPNALREARLQELLANVTDAAAHAALIAALARDTATPDDIDDLRVALDGKPAPTAIDAEPDAATSVKDAVESTLELARKYFGRPLPDSTPTSGLPSGRAEDAAIECDLDGLLAEIETLPDAANPALMSPAQNGTDAASLAEQLLGVYLYLYVADPDPTQRSRLANPIRRALAQCGNRTTVLDAYLGGDGFREISDDVERLELLDLAGQADRLDLVRDRRYLDVDLVVAGFPHCMPLAAEVLGSDPDGLAILHEAVDRLVRRYGRTTFIRILRERSLQDPTVVRALLAMGGEHAREALGAVAWSGRLELYTEVVDFLTNAGLPAAERHALANLRPSDHGVAHYLQELMRTLQDGTVSEAARRQTAELLRRQVHRARADDDVQRLTAAIADLALAPDAKSRELLEDFAGNSRWKQLFDRLGPARTKAREVLDALGERR